MFPTFISDYVFFQNKASQHAQDRFSPSKVKKWVMDDFNETISWLESQEEKANGIH